MCVCVCVCVCVSIYLWNRSDHPSHHEHKLLPQTEWVSCWKERKELFYLTMNSTHFIYNYMALDICFFVYVVASSFLYQ